MAGMNDKDAAHVKELLDIAINAVRCEYNTKFEVLTKLIDTRMEVVDTQISAIEKATILAAGTMDKRLDGMNEFRSALKDAQNTFLTVDEYTRMHEKVLEDVKVLREDKARAEGKASIESVNQVRSIADRGNLIGFFGILVGVAGVFIALFH